MSGKVMPNYIARRSAFQALNLWLILFSLMIIPVGAFVIKFLFVDDKPISEITLWIAGLILLFIPFIIQIVMIIEIRHDKIEFYDNRIVQKHGIITIHEKQSIFAGVYSVTVSQTLLGRIFNFGMIKVDCPGEWDIDTACISHPQRLKRYLEKRITVRGFARVISN
jgi:membrane protein YdbS with pleckstrin-like domain